MSLVYGSVCSGIEAATVAWEPLGWRAKFFAEIEAFPSRVLAHHFGSNLPGEPLAQNGVPNHGDFTKIGSDGGPIDILVGGTPCQSFSVAGKRLGLDDPRGNLALEYLALARRLGARWIVWENVPGILSSVTDEEAGDGGLRSGLEGRKAGEQWLEESDFATFLEFVRECGYGFSYRILDAQFTRVDGYERAVPQRRRRVFVVGYLGDWRRAAAALQIAEGLRWHPAPQRAAGKAVGPTIASRTRGGGGLGTDFDLDGGLIAVGGFQDGAISGAVVAKWAKGSGGPAGDECQNLVAHTLRGEGCDASEDGTGRGTPIIAFRIAGSGAAYEEGEKSAPLTTGTDSSANVICIQGAAFRENPASGPAGPGINADGAAYTLEARAEVQAVAYDLRGRAGGSQFEGPHDTANIRAASGGSSRPHVAEQWAVRSLTPRECERLQGFPDDWTLIPSANGRMAADSPRYKAVGNSMAVNVMRAIGKRIDMIEKLEREGLIPPSEGGVK